jgi:hypothetical protein
VTLPAHKRFLVEFVDLGGHLNNAAAAAVFVTQCKLPGEQNVPHASWITRNALSLEPFGILALLSVLVAVLAFAMIGVLEPGLTQPAFSILPFAEAAIAAIVARSIRGRRNLDNLTVWDIAGAFTLIGCTAAIFGEPDQAARLFGRPVEQHPDARL